ncbi:replicative DNA helicase [Clostridium sp.]|uniref:replicative DNA helicase n=1 Tax=Clostridium sp. TaxID=1506 RepID=UPI003F307BE8
MELPKAIESEQAILGSMLNYKEVVREVVDILKSEYFYYTNNFKIFREIKELYNEGLVCDIPTLSQSLNNKGILQEVGGVTYLVKLYEGATLGENIRYHCELIKDSAKKRNIIEMSRELIRRAYLMDEKADEIINYGLGEMYKLIGEKGDMYKLSECIDEELCEIEERYNKGGDIIGVDTGFESLNKVIGGLQKGNLFVIAGRPSIGKTAFALNIALEAAKKSTVAIFSFEMSRIEIADRFLSYEGGINLSKIKSGKLLDDDFIKISEASSTLSRRNAYIYDGGALTAEEIKAKSKKLKASVGLDVVVVDYIQLIKSEERKWTNRSTEVGDISRALKNLARELGVNVIAISQLSRGVESRVDKRPVMSDLRESGEIEQDADIIAMLYRDEYYYKDSEAKGICEILIPKNRNGVTGMFKLKWLPNI